MKRKIVKHGASTLTISLPSNWARENNIKQGDELDILEKDNELLICRKKEPEDLVVDIDLRNTKNMLHRIIAAVYKGGFDKVNIRYNHPKELECIQDTIYRYCHEYEIIRIGKDNIEIHSISQLHPDHFDKMLKKSAQSTLNVARETLQAIKNKDFNGLSKLILKDKLVDRCAAFGSRIINKGFSINYHLKGPLYLILDETEISADIFKIISKEIIKKKLTPKPVTIALFESIVEFMELQFDLLFDFEMDKVRKIGEKETKMRELIDRACDGNVDIKILAYLINLFETVFEMKSAIITLRMREFAKDL